MIFLRGRGSMRITTKQVDSSCPRCGNRSLYISVYQMYAHVFWIPTFPLKKYGISNCPHCKTVLEESEMPASLRNACQDVKSKTKAPVVTYLGLILVALLMITGIISSEADKKKYAEIISKPQSGDIYKVEISNNKYTLYKVGRTFNDSVYLYRSEEYVNKVSGLDDLLKETTYSDEAESVSV